MFDPAQHQGIAELLSFPGEGASAGRAWTQGWAAGPKISSLEMGLVFQGDHLILKKQDPEAGAVPDHCPRARARAGPCSVSHLRGVAATRDPAGTVPRGVGRVTPRQDPSVVPSPQELPLLGTSGHICRANPSTSVPSEVQK